MTRRGKGLAGVFRNRYANSKGNGGRTSIYKLLVHLMRSYDLWLAIRLGSLPY